MRQGDLIPCDGEKAGSEWYTEHALKAAPERPAVVGAVAVGENGEVCRPRVRVLISQGALALQACMIDLEVEYAPLSEDGGDALDRLGRCQRRPALLRAPGQTDDETPWACALDGPPVNGHPNLDDAGLGAASAAALQSPWVPSAFPAFTPQVEAPPGSDGGDGALTTAQPQAQAPFSYGSL